MNNKRIKYFVNSSVILIGAIVITVLLNAVLVSFDNKIPLKINLVRDDIYKIADESVAVANSIEQDTTIIVLYTEEVDRQYPQIMPMLEEIIDMYTKQNDKIHFEKLDYVKGYTSLVPYMEKLQTVTDPNYVMIFKQGDRYEVADMSSYMTYDGKSLIERVITNKLASFTDGQSITSVTFTIGHGERGANDGMLATLGAYGYAVEAINLSTQELAVDEKTILIINAPQDDFSTEEIQKLDAYLDHGGNAQIYFNPMLSDTYLPNLEGYLENDWAIKRQHGVAIDMNNKVNLADEDVARYGTISIAEAGESEIVAPIYSAQRSVAVSASNTFEVAGDKSADIEITPILKTSNNTYVKDVSKLSEDKTGEDRSGSFVTMLAATRKNYTINDEQFVGKLLVSGSGYTLDELIDLKSYANADLLLNSFSWASGSKAAIMIREKEIPQNALMITNAQYWPWFAVLVVIIPLAIAVAGFVVWRKRRYR